MSAAGPELPSMTGRMRLVAFIAWPIDPARAPRTYNPAYAARGLDWCHVPMGVHPDELATVLDSLRRLANLQGVNLTIPHKAAAHALCRWLTPVAARCRMVNTLRWVPGEGWAGTNSDGIGFVSALQSQDALDASQPVAIAGCGGAGTAIAFALADHGVKRFTVTDQRPEAVHALRQALLARWPDLQVDHRAEAEAEAGLVVNATPLGTLPGDPMPFDPQRLRADAVLFDIIASRTTECQAAARARGLRVLDGGAMVKHQLEHQIAFWRGEPFTLEPGPAAAFV